MYSAEELDLEVGGPRDVRACEAFTCHDNADDHDIESADEEHSCVEQRRE